ncbi:MAG: GNAT family N-acetyltransferase [Pseudomonadota bacterium]
MSWTLTPALLEDAPAVAAVVAAAYTPYIARIGTKPGPMLDDYAAVIADHIVHVARDGGAPGGTIGGVVVLIEKQDGTILFDNIAVAPEAQGSGLGRRLMDFAEAEAARRGYARLDLYTHHMMTENIEIYARRGYVETDRRTERGFPRVYMAKDLER